jgi:SAM-dependent methyltransferase
VDKPRPAARAELAATFADPGVASAYRHRPPYPPEVFDALEHLITDRPRDVLDLGAGQGALARALAARVDAVDAVDVSAAMLAEGARLPGGRAPNLRWILGAAETAALSGPYALVTAGASLHWMSWGTTLPRLAPLLAEHAFLAVVDHGYHDQPWRADVAEIIVRHSRSPGYDPDFSVPRELSARGLWEVAGHVQVTPVPFRQPAAAYVEQFHSTSALARTWMSAAEAAAFDRAVTRVVAPYAVDGVLEMTVAAELTWGRPVPAA